MVIDPTKPIEIAYLYNSSDTKDTFTFNLLYNQLVQLRRKKLIHEWDTSLAGTKIYEQIKNSLEHAHIIILLISSSFNAEDRYSGVETAALVRKCFNEGTLVWPIIIGPVYWSSFDEYDIFFGKGGKNVQSSASQDEVCRQIAQKIGGQIAHMLSKAWAHDGDKYYRQKYLPHSLSSAFSAYEYSLGYIHDYPPALLGKGRILHEQGKSEEAAQYFQAIISPDIYIVTKGQEAIPFDNRQNSLDYACCKGYALLELKQFAQARQAFQEVYQQIVYPTNSTQRSICAEAYCGEGDACRLLARQVADSKVYYDLACDAYSKATEFVSDNPTYPVGIGKTFIELGNYLKSHSFHERALDIFRQIAYSWPEYAPAWVGKGNALYYLHQLQEALVAYDQALTLNPYEVHAYGGKGYVTLELGNTSEALSAFEKALSLEKNEASYLYSQGKAQAKLGHHQDALVSYNKARDSV